MCFILYISFSMLIVFRFIVTQTICYFMLYYRAAVSAHASLVVLLVFYRASAH